MIITIKIISGFRKAKTKKEKKEGDFELRRNFEKLSTIENVPRRITISSNSLCGATQVEMV